MHSEQRLYYNITVYYTSNTQHVPYNREMSVGRARLMRSDRERELFPPRYELGFRCTWTEGVYELDFLIRKT